MNLTKNILQTVFSKGLILLFNFAVVVISTQLWGAEGRGFIALFIADLGLIGILGNIFTGSSVSYYLSQLGASRLSGQAYLWIFITSILGGAIFYFHENQQIALPFFITSCFFGIIAFHNSLFIGSQKINYYNILTLLQPALLLIFIIAFYFLFPAIGYFIYFYAQIVSLTVLVGIALILRKRYISKLKLQIDKEAIGKSFAFGWQTELSNLLQFVNYRLSFYFLGALSGTAPVGVFSIGITIAEAIWIISRSISLVQYSHVLSHGDTPQARKETMKVSLISLWASLGTIVILLLIPEPVFGFIFGEEFVGVKKVLLYLSPGVLAIAISNVYGNYFSAIGQLKILILKSGTGVIVTVLLSYLLIGKYGITGACIVNSVSYMITSVVLLVWFLKRKR
ncbi:MAG: polysaccharide biosynthesis C-terminal domain-containing protein [Bacteroidales bacterium]|nr:polysaccharide biosynthesis C-terminal domain-containing protein [Bacteroidales bacterium]